MSLSKSRRATFRSGVSLGALALMAMAVAAQAQDTVPPAEESDEVVVVVGVRKALQTAQKIKKDANTIVDSITATDIGAFPDKSVAEALQRVPGITVSRFAAGGDTRYLTAEPSGILVRGLNQVKSHFNGRDIFSANSNRGLSWEDVTPELMSRVDVYKNQTADLIEGGIAGTIDLRTRVPFDQKGQSFALSADVSYTDIAEELSPALSGLYSNRWDTEIGEFGFLANLAYSKTSVVSQGSAMGQYAAFDGTLFGTTGDVWIPSTVTLRHNEYTRERVGVALAGQWKSNDATKLLTVQFNRSDYEQSNNDSSLNPIFFGVAAGGGRDGARKVITSTAADPGSTAPIAGTGGYQFGADGGFLKGTLGRPGGGDCANPSAAPGQLIVNQQGVQFYECNFAGNSAHQILNESRVGDLDQYNQDLSINFKWDVSDKTTLTLDGQLTDAEQGYYSMTSNIVSYATVSLDMQGDRPFVTIDDSNPVGVNLSAGGLSNPNNWYPFVQMDHTDDSDGQQKSIAADVEHRFDTSWLKSVKAGARASSREQTVRWSAYNWGAAVAPWQSWSGQTNETNFHLDKSPWPQGSYTLFDLPYAEQTNISQIIQPNHDFLHDAEAMKQYGYKATGIVGASGIKGFICENTGARAGETVVGKTGCYLPSEVQHIEENTSALYAMVNFGGSDAELINGITVSGNAGVRVVNTQILSDGFTTFPIAFSAGELSCLSGLQDPLSPNYVPNSPYNQTPGCSVTQQDRDFNNAGTQVLTAESEFTDVLPSFNLRLAFPNTWIARFAYSKGISRPDIGYMRNFSQISRNLTQTGNSALDIRYTANRGNPYLKPTKADSYDVSVENYFSSNGFLAATLFFKKFENYVIYGSSNENITNNGVTRPVLVNQPINGEGASITGLELQYQRFFDFLPSPWNGFGVQANYTILSNTGVENTHLTATTTGSNGNGSLGDDGWVNPDALVGISDQSANLVGMFEKGPVAIRLAYSWRSEWLVTDADCCLLFPIWQEAQGFLDASFRYKLSDNLELSVQGSNLLDTKTRLTQQVDDAGGERKMMPYVWYENDRRVQFGVRLKY